MSELTSGRPRRVEAVAAARAVGEDGAMRGELAVVLEISTGDVGVYACALGGDDGRTLFLCTAPGFAEHERRDTREARLLSTRVDAPAA